MNSLSDGEAHAEPTPETTTRVEVETLGGEKRTYYLEPGNTLGFADDGPVHVSVTALSEAERISE